MEQQPAFDPIDAIVKFGGSAITDKCQLETLKEDNLASAADVIRQCVEHGLRCVVVHGAGSFGHHQAKEYQVNAGLRGTQEEVKSRRLGMCLTRLSVTKLNHMVVKSLVDKDVNAVGLPAVGSWLTANGQVSRHGMTGTVKLLDNGFVPVLHGDCVLDSCKGCNILSGDVIIKTICKEQMVKRVVFLSDVAGVYDKPPSQADAEHIPRISVSQDGTMIDISTSKNQYDVTGGMTLKIQTATDIVRNSSGKTKVFITKVGSRCVNLICKGLDTGQENTKSFTEIVYHQ